MNALKERRPTQPERPVDRGGLWSIGEVLAELLPRLAPPAVVCVEAVPIAAWGAVGRTVEVELASV